MFIYETFYLPFQGTCTTYVWHFQEHRKFTLLNSICCSLISISAHFISLDSKEQASATTMSKISGKVSKFKLMSIFGIPMINANEYTNVPTVG